MESILLTFFFLNLILNRLGLLIATNSSKVPVLILTDKAIRVLGACYNFTFYYKTNGDFFVCGKNNNFLRKKSKAIRTPHLLFNNPLIKIIQSGNSKFLF